MSEKNKDAAIKLFGMTIPLQQPPPPAGGWFGKFDQKESESPKSNDQEHESRNSSSSTCEINKPTPADDDSASTKNSNSNSNSTVQQQAANSDDQLDAKGMKKPDKILPCPRCKSLDTKFCYFNNYNVNQPRHFCKNCQRYWTAGGTMRNVPVGAGRRKSKSSSLFRRITVDVVHPNSGLIKPNPATVLSFAKPPPGPSAADAPSPCFPIPFLYPAAYLSCGAPPGSWSLPWLPPAPGKRSREDYERALMRIDDPEEAARSSVWTVVSGGKGGAFQAKGDRVKNHRAVLEAPLLLHSNPAALARSLNFQETI